jgi:lipopolysaccharide transport system ATP-binding protein
MNSVAAAEGRTVLFVSHNMAVVQHLCQLAILLRNGSIVCDDAPPAANSQYLSDAVAGNRVEVQSWADRTTTGEARITKLEFDDGCNGTVIFFGGNLRIRIHAQLTATLNNPVFGVVIHDAAGVPISNVQSINEGLYTGTMSDEVLVQADFPNLKLYPGGYLLSPWITDSACQHAIDFPRMRATFDVHPAPGKFGDLLLQQSWGKVFIPSQWEVVCHR